MATAFDNAPPGPLVVTAQMLAQGYAVQFPDGHRFYRFRVIERHPDGSALVENPALTEAAKKLVAL